MDDIKKKYRKRWFGYFDLLGFSDLVRSNKISSVLPIYRTALRAIESKAGTQKQFGISYTWFSDTFILYTRSSSIQEFANIEQACRLFFQKLILEEIPVKGALTVGPVYTNRKMNTYIGEGLIDAYEYGEYQNWLGFLLTPSVYEHLKDSDIPLTERPFYSQIEANILTKGKPYKNTYAYNFNNGNVNKKNIYLPHLKNMKSKVDKSIKIKYENTEKFIHNNTLQMLS